MNKTKHFYLQLFFALCILCLVSCGDEEPAPGATITDSRDGRVYKTVQMGSQLWLGENLKYESPSAGTSICYDNNSNNCANYGRLYDFQAALVACPEGWHLPSDAEWKTLESFLGIPADELDVDGGPRGTDEGEELINGAFKAELSGVQISNTFLDINEIFSFWTSTSTENASNNAAFIRDNLVDDPRIVRTGSDKTNRLCVRCLKD